jgi:hypothetical protein
MDIEFKGDALSLSRRAKNILFKSTMHQFSSQTNTEGKDVRDPSNTYNLNHHGYRSPEFKLGTPLLFGGCSYTYGLGIPEESIWGVQLAKKMGVDYANVSRKGASTSWVVDQVLAYCREFGNPKYIVLTFPNFFRGTYLQNIDVVVSPGHSPKTAGDNPIEIQSYNLFQIAHAEYPRLSKRPHEINDVTPPELPIYETMRSIRTIEQYCKAANINLRWGFFEGGGEQMAREIEKEYGFSDRVDLNRGMWRNEYGPELYGSFLLQERGNQYEHCHEDQRKIWGDAFDLGTDRIPAFENAHPGVHSHIHIAEDYYESLKMIGLDNE